MEIILDYLGEFNLIIWVLKYEEPFLTGLQIRWKKEEKTFKAQDKLDWPLFSLKMEQGFHELIQQPLEIGNHPQITASKKMVTWFYNHKDLNSADNLNEEKKKGLSHNSLQKGI